MFRMVTNILGKGLVSGVKLTSYGLGSTAAHKMFVLEMRAVSHITAGYTAGGTGKQVVDGAKSLGINPLREEDTSCPKTQLMKEIVALTLLSAVTHDATSYVKGPAPKIYNTLLTATPIRVLNTSILDAVKETIRTFNAKELFVVS